MLYSLHSVYIAVLTYSIFIPVINIILQKVLIILDFILIFYRFVFYLLVLIWC